MTIKINITNSSSLSPPALSPDFMFVSFSEDVRLSSDRDNEAGAA